MNPSRLTLVAALSVLILGCQSTGAPSETVAEEALCPVIEPVACPACEIQACPEPEPETAVPLPVAECPAVPEAQCTLSSKYPIIGEIEWATVETANLVLEARIDTGAETSSIHAENIQLVEKDGKRWVRFMLLDPETDAEIELERRLHRRVLVKQKATDETDMRYVVRMWVIIGEERIWLDVSLSDREDFEFPLLIGRNMLMDAFVVDVSRHHTLPKPSPVISEVK